MYSFKFKLWLDRFVTELKNFGYEKPLEFYNERRKEAFNFFNSDFALNPEDAATLLCVTEAYNVQDESL